VESNLVEKAIQVEPTVDGFYDKSRLIRESPYERTLFIDADTYVVEPIPELFSLVDKFECAATHEEYLSTDWFKHYPTSDVPVSFPEFNTGILLLKKSDKMMHVLREWGDLYKALLKEKPGQAINDQPFFRVAAYKGDIRIATLTREYDCKYRGQRYLNGPVKIIHGHIDLRLDTAHIQGALRVLNASHRPRVYIAGRVYEQQIVGRLVGRRKAHKLGSFPELPGSILLRRLVRLKSAFKEMGLGGVLARSVKITTAKP